MDKEAKSLLQGGNEEENSLCACCVLTFLKPMFPSLSFLILGLLTPSGVSMETQEGRVRQGTEGLAWKPLLTAQDGGELPEE